MTITDRCFYVDEVVRDLAVPNDKYKRKLTAIGAGVGVKRENMELIDWCGLLYYSPHNHFNGRNGYWQLLGKQCLEIIRTYRREFRPRHIYVCNQMASYIRKAIETNGIDLKEMEKLAKSIIPVIQKDYKNESYVYKLKQDVGRLVRKKLKIDISRDVAAKVLEGRLYDLRNDEFVCLKL